MATGLPSLLQAFFTDRLLRQQRASPNTIASYRDTFRLLLQFAQQQTGKPPTKLTMEVLEPAFLAAFLNTKRLLNRHEPVIEHARSGKPRGVCHEMLPHAGEHIDLAAIEQLERCVRTRRVHQFGMLDTAAQK